MVPIAPSLQRGEAGAAAALARATGSTVLIRSQTIGFATGDRDPPSSCFQIPTEPNLVPLVLHMNPLSAPFNPEPATRSPQHTPPVRKRHSSGGGEAVGPPPLGRLGDRCPFDCFNPIRWGGNWDKWKG